MLDLSDFSILKKVISPSGMPYASASANYAFAEFARDAIEACMDIIPTLPKEVAEPIARDTIKRLAELQGTQNTEDILRGKDITQLTSEEEALLKQLTLSEERKGKIHHEHRFDMIADTPIPLHAQKILSELSMIWGGSEHEMTYYGSLDATPQFIRLISLYTEHYGKAILKKTYVTKTGTTQTIREALLAAVSHIESELQKSEVGLYEMYRINTAGLKNQTWKDSPSSLITLERTLPNYEKHIIPLSVQGLVYDALIASSNLLNQTHPNETKRWLSLAEKVQRQTFRLFWMEEEHFFSSALCLNEKNKWVQIKTLSSDPVNLLHTRIFDTVEKDEKQKYLEGIITQIYSEQFVTDVGIRCRAKKHADLVDYTDYHGVEAVWPKETYDCIVGLRRQGFLRLAEQLGLRILNGILIADSFAELFFVKPDGRVFYDPHGIHIVTPHKEVFYATSVPEDTQTWSMTAALAEYQMQKAKQDTILDTSTWQYEFEEKLLRIIPKHKLLTTQKEVEAALPTDYSFSIDLEEGKKRAAKYENLLIHAELHKTNLSFST